MCPIYFNCGSVFRTTDGPRDTADQQRQDLDLVKATLHHLAVHGLPDDASSPGLGPATAVTKEMAVKGIGDVGSVSVPPGLWDLKADPHLLFAGVAAPHSTCPKVEALLQTLC